MAKKAMKQPDPTMTQMNAARLSAYLKVIAMKDRMEQVKFGPDFNVIVADGDDEIALMAKSDLKFPHEFAVANVKMLTKFISAFSSKDEEASTIEMAVGDDLKLVIKRGRTIVYFQCADPSVLNPPPDFADQEVQLIGEDPLDVELTPASLADFDTFRKLVEANVVQFKLDEVAKLVRARHISGSSRNEVEIDLGSVGNSEITDSHRSTMTDFKVSGDALRDVFDGVNAVGDDRLYMDFGQVLRVRYKDGGHEFTFLISPQVPVDTTGETVVDDEEEETSSEEGNE